MKVQSEMNDFSSKYVLQSNVIYDSTKRQYIIIIVFLVSILMGHMFSPLMSVLKVSVIPISLLLLFKYDVFEYMIFPICFLNEAIGPYFGTVIDLRLIYLPFFLVKVVRSRGLKMDYCKFGIIIFLTLYFGYEIISYKITQFLFIIYIFCFLMLSNDFVDRSKRILFLYVLSVSGMVSAVTLAFGLSGINELTSRAVGIGYADANYASLVCLIGFSALLNYPVESKVAKCLKIIGSLIFALGIFRSGSRAGFIVFILVMVSKGVFTKDIGKKVKYLGGLLVLLLLALFAIESGIIQISYLDALVSRWDSTFSAFHTGNLTYATAGRNTVLNNYMTYFCNQNLFAKFFGGNIPSSSEMLSVGNGYVTHNVYVDLLLAVGFAGAIYLLAEFLRRIIIYFSLYRKENDITYLAFVQMKMAILLMGISLALWQVTMWWLIILV